jgi:hypothetical protein
MKGTKIIVPEELKKEVPHTTFGKILAATPVAMAVVATMLAGLASSEMTKAQYDRSLAAQQQSKAGDQWSFFQAKRLRGAYQRNTADLVQNLTDVRQVDAAAIQAFARQAPAENKAKADLLALLDSASGQQAIALLQKGELPAAPGETKVSIEIQKALDTVESFDSDAEVAAALANVSIKELDAAVRNARERARAFDTATTPASQTIDRLENLVLQVAASAPKSQGAGAGGAVARDLAAARLKYAALRYETEARLNQSVANLYELQVRKSNLSAERRHSRSQRFFFGMLGAQLAVIISTFAMAARQKNLLWSLAAGAGLLAIIFAVVVYLTM